MGVLPLQGALSGLQVQALPRLWPWMRPTRIGGIHADGCRPLVLPGHLRTFSLCKDMGLCLQACWCSRAPFWSIRPFDAVSCTHMISARVSGCSQLRLLFRGYSAPALDFGLGASLDFSQNSCCGPTPCPRLVSCLSWMVVDLFSLHDMCVPLFSLPCYPSQRGPTHMATW